MPRHFILLSILLSVLLVHPAAAEDPKTVSDKLSYAAGYQMGEHFRKQKMKVRTDMVMQGLQAAIRNEKPIMTKGEMRLILQNPKMALHEERQTFREENRQKGREYLEANAQKEGVVVLESGVQYKIIRPGTGRQPSDEDTVQMHYRGENLEGYAFVNTYEAGEPDEMETDLLIPGLAEVLPLMKEGAHWEIYIPEDLAYGSHGPLADKTLVYKLELLSILSAE